MPTKEEFQELIDNCQCDWVTYNGVNGRKLTSKKEGYTDNWIFLPAAGYYEGKSRDDIRSFGYYWSSSLRSVQSEDAWGISLGSGSSNITVYCDERCIGLSVRPVCDR